MHIESIHIQNYRMFRDVKIENIPKMSVFVGANGSGKSTLFDVFGFLRDSLIHNVRQALARRGGFSEVVTRGTDGPIVIELKFRDAAEPLVTYHVSIGLENGQPIVERELLKYRRGQNGQPWHFLDFQRGQGKVVTNEDEYGKPGIEMRREDHRLESNDILAIKGLGQFQKFKTIMEFRKLIENWHVSDFHISEARPSRESGIAEHLSSLGDNLPLFAQYLFEKHPELFHDIIERMKRRVPGVTEVMPIMSEDGRILLKFKDGAFIDPFIARYVSDGTIKMFAYLLLLYDPSPHPVLCVEEPENQLYPHLLVELAEEFRDYSRRGGQVFISTHSPDFLNAVDLSEVFWLSKQDGLTTVHRAKDYQLFAGLVREGDTLGNLWRQGFFQGADPQ